MERREGAPILKTHISLYYNRDMYIYKREKKIEEKREREKGRRREREENRKERERDLNKWFFKSF